VSTPLHWPEVERGVRPEGLAVATVPARLAAQGDDPWAAIGTQRQSIGAAVRRHLGF
jgi:DNA primase